MKKILFITVIAVVFILASCTLAPFAYLFGGGTFIGGGSSPSRNEGELVLDFSQFAFGETFLNDVSFFVIDIQGQQNLRETIHLDEIIDGKKSFKLKSGDYFLKVNAYNANGRNIGQFSSNVSIEKGKKATEKVSFDETITLTLKLAIPQDDFSHKRSSRALNSDGNQVTLIIRQGGGLNPPNLVDDLWDKDRPIYYGPDTKSYTAGDQNVEFTVTLAKGHEYGFEAYVQNTAYQPAEEVSTLLTTLSYGATYVQITSDFDEKVYITTEDVLFSATPTINDTFSNEYVNPEVTVTFPASFTSNRYDGAYFTTASQFYYTYATSTEATSASAQVNSDSFNDNNLTVKYKSLNSSSLFFSEEDATGIYYYWFVATDTNNMPFVFPLGDYDGVDGLDPFGFEVVGEEDTTIVIGG